MPGPSGSLDTIVAETRWARRDHCRSRRAFSRYYVAGRPVVRARSGFEGGRAGFPGPPSRRGDRLADPQADAEQAGEVVEPQGVGAVGEGLVGPGVDLEEEGVAAGG